MNPYSLIKEAKGKKSVSFNFVTSTGIEYVARFDRQRLDLTTPANAPVFLYTFNLLHKSSSLPQGKDQRISDTVISILSDFLRHHENAVFMVCDASDGREKARFRKFTHWFQKAGSTQVESKNFERLSPYGNIYAAVYINSANPNKTEILAALTQLIDSGKMTAF